MHEQMSKNGMITNLDLMYNFQVKIVCILILLERILDVFHAQFGLLLLCNS